MRATFLMAVLCGGAWSAAAAAQEARPAEDSTTPTAPAAPAPLSSAILSPTTTTKPASRPADPLATPESAVRRLFELLAQNDVTGVRAMLTEPPPLDHLKRYVAEVGWKLKQGAKVELVESKVEGSAAVVLYRTTYPTGQVEIAPVILVGRYDRWKVIFGQANPNRYTTHEKANIVKVGTWMQARLKALNPAATQPAPPAQPAQPASTKPVPAPAAH